jgi:hypothetical protein
MYRAHVPGEGLGLGNSVLPNVLQTVVSFYVRYSLTSSVLFFFWLFYTGSTASQGYQAVSNCGIIFLLCYTGMTASQGYQAVSKCGIIFACVTGTTASKGHQAVSGQWYYLLLCYRYDSLTGVPSCQRTVAFEKASVLFNIGGLYTQIGKA